MKKLIVLALAGLLFLVGCGSGGTAGEGGGTGEFEKDFTFISNTSNEPQSFHPNRTSDDGAWPVNQNIFNRLVKLNAYNTYVPDLATDWEFTNDGKTLTFNLHDNVVWHDGTKFTSEDVKYTFDTMIAEAWQHSSSFASVDSIDTPDDNTVVFNLKNADSSIISKLSWYGTFIVPKHVYDGTDTATNPANQNPIGTGPFKFDKYESGVAVTLKRNDDFFGDDIDVETLIFRIIPDESTLYQAFINGEVDYLGSLPTANVDSLDGDDNYEIIQSLGINRTYVTFNFADEDFGKVEVRQAVAYALDQQSVYDRVGGAGAKAESLISPVFTDYVDPSVKLPETDTAKAIELLEGAGYTKNANGYYIEADFDYFVSGNFGDIAAIVAANLEKVGIKLKLNALEMSAWQTKVMDNSDFAMTMLAGYQGPDVSGVDNRVKSTGSTNLAGYSNPALDEALTKGAQASTIEDRKPFYVEAQKIMLEDLPIIQILDNGYKTPIKKEFTGTPYQDKTKASGEFSGVKKTK